MQKTQALTLLPLVDQLLLYVKLKYLVKKLVKCTGTATVDCAILQIGVDSDKACFPTLSLGLARVISQTVIKSMRLKFNV